MSAFFIWFVLCVIPSFSTVFCIIGVMSLIIFLSMLYYRDECGKEENEEKPTKEKVDKWANISFIILLISIVCFSMTPSKKEAAAIFLISEVSQNENIAKLSGKSLDALNIVLDDIIETHKKGKK